VIKPLSLAFALALLFVGSFAIADHHHHHRHKHHHKHKDKAGKVIDVVDDEPGGELVACITDCACVQSYCPVGDRSCTACWMYEHTNVGCTPDPDEEATYGHSCPAR